MHRTKYLNSIKYFHGCCFISLLLVSDKTVEAQKSNVSKVTHSIITREESMNSDFESVVFSPPPCCFLLGMPTLNYSWLQFERIY